MPCSSPVWSEVSVFCRSPVVSSSSGLSRIWAAASRTGVLRTGSGGGRGEQDLEAGAEEGAGDRTLLILPCSRFSRAFARGEACGRPGLYWSGLMVGDGVSDVVKGEALPWLNLLTSVTPGRTVLSPGVGVADGDFPEGSC